VNIQRKKTEHADIYNEIVELDRETDRTNSSAENEKSHHYFQRNISSSRPSFGKEYATEATMSQAADAFILSVDAFQYVSGVG
jgi:hypothetical protein